MPRGEGKYDDMCTLVRVVAKAEGAAVIVVNGEQGNGFSIQAPPHVMEALPDILENMAAEIRKSMA